MAIDVSNGAVSAETLAEHIEAGERVPILDVRNRDEISAWQIEGPDVELTHVPYMEFVSAQVTGDVADLVDDEGYLVVCPRGESSAEVATLLEDAGIGAANLAGGMEAWAGVYRETSVPVSVDVDVLQFRRPASGCLAYELVADGEALLVDPLRAMTDHYVAAIDDVEGIDRLDTTIEYVVDTHLHADHVSGLRSLADATGATPLVSAGGARRGVEFDHRMVAGGDELHVGDVTVDVLATPGHTSGSISLRCGDVLLTGDALFLDGTPRPDLERGDDGARDLARTLHETLTERLARVPDDVLVAPGHYVPGRTPAADGTYTARMGELRDRLAVFEESTEVFTERILDSMGARPANFERIIAANLGRETLDDDTAFEVELGPNNCAVNN